MAARRSGASCRWPTSGWSHELRRVRPPRSLQAVIRAWHALALVTAGIGGAILVRPMLDASTATPSPAGVAPAFASCESLTSIAAQNVTVTRASSVDAGAFTPDSSTSLTIARPFCRVIVAVKPSADSDITVEIWLPARDWNGKFQAVGNGAFSGTINYRAMATALARGYATASTDTGHVGGGAKWALGHPEKVVDFGWRAVHEMTVVSKQVVAAHYGRPARYAYWNGCSAGGRQGMQGAQRFPEDFDGIIAGAPGLDWTGRAAQAVRIAKMLEGDEPARLPAASRQLLYARVIAACDAIDGVEDGLLENPDRCSFDPGVLECRGSDRASCLTSAQVATARAIYASPINTKTRRPIPGLARGSELGWTDLGWTASARATGLDQFRYLVFRDPNWTISKFDFDADLARAEEADANTLNALNSDLRRFIDRGGKMIQYHGWSDPQIAPGISPQYYDRVVAALGGADTVRRSYRLFMAPGMGHCGGGEGPNTFDMVTVLEQWVEHNSAPDRIVASRSTGGGVRMTRPLCPYPDVASYKGSGDTNDASSFVCK
jgi:feruloyl esterase